jgi:hypothetical protein
MKSMAQAMPNGTFKLQLAAFAEKTKARANEVVRKVLFEVATSLVYKSPVGDGAYWQSPPPKGYVGGRFRANWQFAEGSIDYTTTETTDASGERSLGAIEALIPATPVGKVFYLTNSLPYAQRIEDGWSHRQAPNGVVRLTVVEWQDFIDKAIREIKSS